MPPFLTAIRLDNRRTALSVPPTALVPVKRVSVDNRRLPIDALQLPVLPPLFLARRPNFGRPIRTMHFSVSPPYTCPIRDNRTIVKDLSGTVFAMQLSIRFPCLPSINRVP